VCSSDLPSPSPNSKSSSPSSSICSIVFVSVITESIAAIGRAVTVHGVKKFFAGR
jgi:hypothetical protein